MCKYFWRGLPTLLRLFTTATSGIVTRTRDYSFSLPRFLSSLHVLGSLFPSYTRRKRKRRKRWRWAEEEDGVIIIKLRVLFTFMTKSLMSTSWIICKYMKTAEPDADIMYVSGSCCYFVSQNSIPLSCYINTIIIIMSEWIKSQSCCSCYCYLGRTNVVAGSWWKMYWSLLVSPVWLMVFGCNRHQVSVTPPLCTHINMQWTRIDFEQACSPYLTRS